MKKSKVKNKNMKCLSMDIGSSYIKFALGQNMSNRLKIDRVFETKISDGIYENGHILDIQGMKSVVQNAINKNGGQAKAVICTLETTEVIKRDIIVPTVAAEDLSEMVKYEIGQYLPIDINSYVLQHKILREFEEDNVNKYELQVVAFPEKIAYDIHLMLVELGHNPIALDINSNAIDKMVSEAELINGLNIKSNTIVLLDIGYQNINIIVVENGQYKFNRIIKFGTKDFEQFNMDFSFTNIDEISQYIDVIDTWVDEMNKVFKYYISRGTENRIDKIFIYGGISVMEGLDTFIQDRLNISTEVIGTVDNIEILSGNENTLAHSLNAISALIRL